MAETSNDPALPNWPRPHFVAGGGNANLFYKVHGHFTGAPEVSRLRHRCAGIPTGCELYLQSREEHRDAFRFGLDGYTGEQLRQTNPDLFEAVASAPRCLSLRGEIQDPPTLDYFRDAIGLVTALLDSGGVGVFDPFQLRWWSIEEWRTRAFAPGGPVPRHHVVILVSEEDIPHRSWYHTRGMLKFGRPDLSVRGVPAELTRAVEDLCNRFIEMMASGAVVSEGQPVRMNSLPDGWRCFHRGDLDDPDFNNRHIEIGLPDIGALTIGMDGLDLSDLLADWRWLLPGDVQAFAMGFFGDWFLERPDGSVVMLDTVAGKVRELAPNRRAFIEAMSDTTNLDDWFMQDLLFSCLSEGKKPGPGQCLSFIVPPVVNGKLVSSNVEVSAIAVHQSLTAQIHEQVKDLPEGTVIRDFTLDKGGAEG